MCKNTNKYTIKQFREDFPNDNACLDKIFLLKYENYTHCPECNSTFNYSKVNNRQCYQCSKCRNQIYPCAGTPFEKTRTPLTIWFYVIYLFTVSKNGISAYEVQRQTGVTYKTAWRMLKQIRVLCSKDNVNFFSGTVELDETFVGGKNKNRHADKKVKNSQGRSFKDKTPVFGIFHRESKKVKAFTVTDTKRATIQPIIYNEISQNVNVYTDEWSAYMGLSKYYNHKFVDHSKKQYADGDITTNRIENFWSVFKRTLNGSYIQVSRKHLQLYVNECCFRINHRESNLPVFHCLLNLLSE